MGSGQKRSKNQLRREKAKQRKLEGEKNGVVVKKSSELQLVKSQDQQEEADELEIHVEDTPLYSQFEGVLKRFGAVDGENEPGTELNKGKVQFSDDEDEEEDGDGEGDAHDSSDDAGNKDDKPLSRRQYRKKNKISLATLKASVSNPQVVEWYDADAEDPVILVHIKSIPNVVPVPAHWSAKREYLASRRGIQKPPFQLPSYIQDTGIQEMRRNDDQTLKQQQRDRVLPKMGKLDIDYQKLYDAFFKYQSKPRLFGFGDVYYEGREVTDEYADEIKNIRPGVISSKLRAALGMDEHNHSVPPPWISVMLYMGKPPAYEDLIIPGLDTEYSNDGYFAQNYVKQHEFLSREHWGRLEDAPESSEEEEDEEEEEEEDQDHDDESISGGTDHDQQIQNPELHPHGSVHERSDTAGAKLDGIDSKKLITEFGIGANQSSRPSEEPAPSKGQLYTVISEKQAVNGKGLVPNEVDYDLKNQRSPEPEVNQRHHQDNSNNKHSGSHGDKKFKF